jgi:hypothetical protein
MLQLAIRLAIVESQMTRVAQDQKTPMPVAAYIYQWCYELRQIELALRGKGGKDESDA